MRARWLQKIAKGVARHDSTVAERVARTITDPEWQAEALGDIARVILQVAV
jgi:transcription termination factor NusB